MPFLIKEILIWASRVLLVQFVMKLIAGLGLGTFAYYKVSEFWLIMQQKFHNEYNKLPSIVLALLDIGGFTTGIEILFSGVTFLVGWYSVTLGFAIFAGK